MQIVDSYNQKNSLFNAMNRFIGAVNNMDQTVMVPSLLRDVPLDQEDEKEVNSFHNGDMYGSYALLKSIRNDIEWGVLQADERRKEKHGVTTATLDVSRVEPDDENLEKLFHFHLHGLHTVLAKLTRKANTLTNRYKQEIGIGGCGNWGRAQEGAAGIAAKPPLASTHPFPPLDRTIVTCSARDAGLQAPSMSLMLFAQSGFYWLEDRLVKLKRGFI